MNQPRGLNQPLDSTIPDTMKHITDNWSTKQKQESLQKKQIIEERNMEDNVISGDWRDKQISKIRRGDQ